MKTYPVAPMGGEWLDRDKGVYKTRRGNIAQLTKSQLRAEKRLTLNERLARLEAWANSEPLRRCEIMESVASMRGI